MAPEDPKNHVPFSHSNHILLNKLNRGMLLVEMVNQWNVVGSGQWIWSDGVEVAWGPDLTI